MTGTTGAGARAFDLALVQRAARYAEEAHADDHRKGTSIPYVSHLWSVAALVMENGGDSEQVAAALLHDVVEDHGGRQRLADVERHFGLEVARMVEALSDTVPEDPEADAKPPWRQRKQDYLDHLLDVDDRTALVSAADKLHNLRCILSDFRATGPVLWERFNTTDPADHLWYHRNLVERLVPRIPPSLAGELTRTFDALEHLVAERHGRAAIDR